MRHRFLQSMGLLALAIVAVVPASGSPLTASPRDGADWQEWVLTEESRSTYVPTAESIETMEYVHSVFYAYPGDWALSHFADDGTVVINVKRGREDAVDAVIADAKEHGPGPVTIRLVDHSYSDLMDPGGEPVRGRVLAGSQITGHSVDPALNALVVAMVEVGPEQVAEVHEVYGEGTYLRQRPQARS